MKERIFTPKEEEKLLKLYSNTSLNELRKIFPHHTPDQMFNYISRHNENVRNGKIEGEIIVKDKRMNRKKVRVSDTGKGWQEYDPKIFKLKTIRENIYAFRNGYELTTREKHA